MELAPYSSSEAVKRQDIPWNIEMINAPSFWEYSRGGRKVIAVIDTGLDVDHPEFEDRIINPCNYTSSKKSDVADIDGHGTHAAGIIGGKNTGVAPECRIMPFKVFADNPAQTALNMQNAFRDIKVWNEKCCLQDKIVAVNCSFGSSNNDPILAYYIRMINSSGVPICVAAGNSGDSNPATHEIFSYPAFLYEVVSVSSVDRYGNISNYSSSFDGIDIAAPGSDIYSAWPNESYKFLSGTSMSTPHAAGACALLADFFHKREGRLPANGELDESVPHFTQAEGILLKHTRKVNGNSYLFGRGILDLTFVYKRWPLNRIQVGAYYYPAYAGRMEQILKNADFPALRVKY